MPQGKVLLGALMTGPKPGLITRFVQQHLLYEKVFLEGRSVHKSQPFYTGKQKTMGIGRWGNKLKKRHDKYKAKVFGAVNGAKGDASIGQATLHRRVPELVVASPSPQAPRDICGAHSDGSGRLQLISRQNP